MPSKYETTVRRRSGGTRCYTLRLPAPLSKATPNTALPHVFWRLFHLPKDIHSDMKMALVSSIYDLQQPLAPTFHIIDERIVCKFGIFLAPHIHCGRHLWKPPFKRMGLPFKNCRSISKIKEERRNWISNNSVSVPLFIDRRHANQS